MENQYQFSLLPDCRCNVTILQRFRCHDGPQASSNHESRACSADGFFSLRVLASYKNTPANPIHFPAYVQASCCIQQVVTLWFLALVSQQSASSCLTHVDADRRFLTLYTKHRVRETTLNKEMRPGLLMCSTAVHMCTTDR